MTVKDENPTLTKAKLFARRIVKMYGYLAVYWFALLQDSGLLTETMSSSMLADANELVAMLVSAIKKVR